MNRLFALLTALFAATAGTVATAQDFPALFKVVNVAPGDWLNIRAEPNARAPIVGRFDRTAVSIEVVGLSEDRHWGLVRTDEGIGWSSMRYLQAERTDSCSIERSAKRLIRPDVTTVWTSMKTTASACHKTKVSRSTR